MHALSYGSHPKPRSELWCISATDGAGCETCLKSGKTTLTSLWFWILLCSSYGPHHSNEGYWSQNMALIQNKMNKAPICLFDESELRKSRRSIQISRPIKRFGHCQVLSDKNRFFFAAKWCNFLGVSKKVFKGNIFRVSKKVFKSSKGLKLNLLWDVLNRRVGYSIRDKVGFQQP